TPSDPVILDKIDGGGPMRRPLSEIGVKQDVDAVVHIRATEHSCAKLLSNAAMGAVGGDDVGRTHGLLLAARPIFKDNEHAIRLLLECYRLGRKFQFAQPLLFSKGAKDRLKIVLSTQAIAHRADDACLLAGAPRYAALDLLARERPGPNDH